MVNSTKYPEITFESRIAFIKNQKNRLQQIITHLQPVNNIDKLERIFLNDTISIKRYVLKERELGRLGIKNFKRMAVYRGMGDVFNLDKDANSVVFEVTTFSNEKQFFEIQRNLLLADELQSLLATSGAHVDFSSVGRGKGALGEEFFKDLRNYTSEIESDYKNIHKEINQELQKMIDPSKTYEFIFIGCGKGEEVKELLQSLEKNRIKYRIYGIDLDAGNIQTAQSSHEFVAKTIKFIKGDANDFDQLIKELRRNFSEIIPDISITISSGFCTRLVNKDPIEAKDIFKVVMHHTNVLVISGRTATLLNNRDAKQSLVLNTQRTYQSDGELRTIDVFELLDINCQVEIILENIKKQTEKKTQTPIIIPLAHNPRPIVLIQALMQERHDIFSANCVIDLQGAFIDLEEEFQTNQEQKISALQLLQDLIEKNNVSILTNEDASWLLELKGHLSTNLDKIQVNPNNYITLIDSSKIADSHSTMFVREKPKVSEKLKERAQTAITQIKHN